MRASILLPPDKQRSLPASQLRHREEQLFTALAIYPHLEVQLCGLSLKKKLLYSDFPQKYRDSRA